MRNERVILCGGLDLPTGSPAKKPIHLNLWGDNPNVTLKIGDISERMAVNIPAIFLDLVEIATYVYCADQATTRGGSGVRNVGAKWRRSFQFHIPVRQPDVWSSKEVLSVLQDTLGFLSEDNFSFEFSEERQAQPIQQYLEFGPGGLTGFQAQAVVLFSGGLDSLAGAVQECINSKQRTVLVSHRPSPKIDTRQRALVTKLSMQCPDTSPLHVHVWIHKDKALSREYTQRTRSFLYASLAAAVACLFNLSRIRFYENGIASLNLPISEQLIGTRATRTTHPQVLNGFAKLFSVLTRGDFKVENPFIWKTKSELVDLIGDADCAELIKYSLSCTSTWKLTRLHPHCGTCSQCIDRRFAALASKYADHDPEEMYKVDLLTGAREVGVDRTMLESYIRTATEIGRMSENEFFSRFGEASRVLRHLEGTPDQTATRIYDLYQRHAKCVGPVLDNGFKQYTTEIREAKLPDSCALILALPEGYKTIKVPIDLGREPTFRKDGERWIVGFAEKSVSMNDRVGMGYIALLLAHPGQGIDVVSLDNAVFGFPPPKEGKPYGKMTKEQLEEYGLGLAESENGEPLVDDEAITECRKEVARLTREIAKAESESNTKRVATLKHQLEQLEQYLRSCTGLRGRPRRSSDPSEKIRKKVSTAISRAVMAIRKEHEHLGRHLLNTITTGDICAYNPDRQIDWQL